MMSLLCSKYEHLPLTQTVPVLVAVKFLCHPDMLPLTDLIAKQAIT